MDRKSSTQVERFCHLILPIAFTVVHVSHQSLAQWKKSATEFLKFFKTMKILDILEKPIRFSEKSDLFQNSKCGKIAVEWATDLNNY